MLKDYDGSVSSSTSNDYAIAPTYVAAADNAAHPIFGDLAGALLYSYNVLLGVPNATADSHLFGNVVKMPHLVQQPLN